MTGDGDHERRGSNGGNEGDAPVSLYPLDFEEALRGLLAVKPPSKNVEETDDGNG